MKLINRIIREINIQYCDFDLFAKFTTTSFSDSMIALIDEDINEIVLSFDSKFRKGYTVIIYKEKDDYMLKLYPYNRNEFNTCIYIIDIGENEILRV